MAENACSPHFDAMVPSPPQAPPETYNLLCNRFETEQAPIPVDFRELLPALRDDGGLQSLHPYPAKILRHIPQFFLSVPALSKPGSLVLDPFCGSGTVLLEALLSGRRAIGADSNPLARLISTAKTTPIGSARLAAGIRRLSRRIPEKSKIEPPDVINRDLWFYPHVQRDLLCVLEAIQRTRADDLRNLFSAVFSRCVRQLSLADPRVPVPVRLKPERYPARHQLREKSRAHLNRLRVANVRKRFLAELQDVSARVVSAFSDLDPQPVHISSDARRLTTAHCRKQRANSVDLVITSPPYMAAQKYIRSSSLSLTWLGYCDSKGLRTLEVENIGREHFSKDEYSVPLTPRVNGVDVLLSSIRPKNSLRAHIAATYLVEMRSALVEVVRVMRPGAHLVLVVGNNTLLGEVFETSDYVTEILTSLGLDLTLCLVDDIRGRGLLTTRHHTSGIIGSEFISVFRKPTP